MILHSLDFVQPTVRNFDKICELITAGTLYDKKRCFIRCGDVEFLTNILIDIYTSVSFCKVDNRRKTMEFCEHIEQIMA